MTVRHLLNQTSGLPLLPSEIATADFDNRPDATERQVRALASLKITRPVGSKVEYSNFNYNILGLIVEAASGETYPDYIQKHIFDPLEMRHSYTSKVVRNGWPGCGAPSLVQPALPCAGYAHPSRFAAIRAAHLQR